MFPFCTWAQGRIVSAKGYHQRSEQQRIGRPAQPPRQQWAFCWDIGGEAGVYQGVKERTWPRFRLVVQLAYQVIPFFVRNGTNG